MNICSMTTGLIGAPLRSGQSKCSSQVKVHAEALHTADVLSRRTLPFFSYFFPNPFKQPQPFSGGKKKDYFYRELYSFWSSWFLPVVWRTARVNRTYDYGMDCKTSAVFRGGGTGC